MKPLTMFFLAAVVAVSSAPAALDWGFHGGGFSGGSYHGAYGGSFSDGDGSWSATADVTFRGGNHVIVTQNRYSLCRRVHDSRGGLGPVAPDLGNPHCFEPARHRPDPRRRDQPGARQADGNKGPLDNPASGNSGTIKLVKKLTRQNQQCEDIAYTVRSGATPVYTEHYRLTSCLQPDGTWKIA